MKVEQNLTKENFWNEQMEKFPKSMKIFCAWIDEYKKAISWKDVFGSSMIKFHDIPYEMQQGIWIRFAKAILPEFFEQAEYEYRFDLEEDIKVVFGEIEADIDEYENTMTDVLIAVTCAR